MGAGMSTIASHEMCICGNFAMTTRPIPLEEGGEVAVGFFNDGFSCPEMAWPLVAPNRKAMLSGAHFGVYLEGGIKHDWRYYRKSCSRLKADSYLLADMLLVIGPCPRTISGAAQWLRSRTRAYAAYAIVRAIGWRYYGKRDGVGCGTKCTASQYCSARASSLHLVPA